MQKYLIKKLQKKVSIILISIIILITFIERSFSEDNVFIIDEIKVEGSIDLKFSRDKFIDKAFVDSFKVLMSKVLLTRDFDKSKDIDLKKIKSLIKSFQIIEETYRNNEYMGIYKIFYDDKLVKKFLAEKNISFSQPNKITSIFFPILFINDEIKNLSENFFYVNWNKIEIKNELINFVLPLEELDDISKMESMKSSIEDIDVNFFTNKYNVKNYAFVFMDYNSKKLNIHVKTNFDNNKMTKNVTYILDDINNESKLNEILKDLKTQITDIWKEANVVNLLMPLSIKVKFKHENLLDLDKLKISLNQINIIDNYDLAEFNINYSLFKIFYHGNPKKLKMALSEFGYYLKDDQGYWEIYINE